MIENVFYNDDATSINKARINHLHSLNLPLKDKKILETGSGARGDITNYLFTHTKDITLNDCRVDNILYFLKNNNVALNFNTWDLNQSLPNDVIFDVIICYGTIYHLENPEIAIQNLSQICKEYMAISTCTNGKNDDTINILNEGNFATQGKDGYGCRPGRNFIFNELKKSFKYVYTTKTQPEHPDFPLKFPSDNEICRCIFIGSHIKLDNDLFLEHLNDEYTY